MATIGTILQRETFSDLSDFDIKGNWEVSSGTLFSLGSNSILQHKYASALDQFQWKIRTNSTNLIVRLYGIRSANNIRTAFSISNGRAKWDFSYNNTNGISDTAITIETTDVLEYVITKTQWSVSFEVKNITKNTSSFVLIPAASSAITAHKIQFYSSAQARIYSFEKTSEQLFEPLNLLVGDSIAYGSSATTSNLRWGTIAGFQIEGSPGDTSVEALELLYEITNIIRPKRVIYAMGTNDLDISVWKVNLQLFKKKVNQKNIVFIPITPYANSNRSMAEYKKYIVENFTEFFDLFSVTKQTTNDNLKSEFNIGDNVHLNNLGHHDCGQFVLNSPYYLFTEIVRQNSSALLAMVVQKWNSLF